MSDIEVKGQPEPIDTRIADMIESSFKPTDEQPTTEPEEEIVEEVTEEEETVEDHDGDDDTGEDEDVDEETTKKPSRAEKRIRQLNEEKKQAESEAMALKLQLAEMKPYLEMLKSQTSEKVVESPIVPQDYDTQEEFAQAILAKAEEKAYAKLQAELAPIQHTMQNQQYLSQINNWFNSNPEAVAVRDQMDAISVDMFGKDQALRSIVEKQIINGNTTMLNALYAMAKPTVKDNSGLVKTAIKADQSKASVGKSTKSTKSSKVVNSNSSYEKALKGDVDDYLLDMFASKEAKLKK